MVLLDMIVWFIVVIHFRFSS